MKKVLVYPIILHLTFCAWNEKKTRHYTTKIQIRRAFIFYSFNFCPVSQNIKINTAMS